ncbi:amidohydrolase [Planctobacterium marinum]|uniref:Amidohydrolase 3 domain-containing protein n=1 Tax=Planctobacterium marinum TaxID=1631968 RepID=A0AA48HEE1_9ALTE|nr:hypothetical protein MACH26_03270 [Planctobacterium marinum]
MKKSMTLSIFAASIMTLGCTTAVDNHSEILVIHGGDIVTVDKKNTVYQQSESAAAVIINNGVIEEVVELAQLEAELSKYKSSDIKYLDLKGRTLMPGFIEPHAHLYQTAQTSSVPNVMPCLPDKYQSQLEAEYGWLYYPEEGDACYLYVDEALASLAKNAKADFPWIIGNGLDPSRMLLSEQNRYEFSADVAQTRERFADAIDKNQTFLNFPIKTIDIALSTLPEPKPLFVLDQSGHLGYANMLAFTETGLCEGIYDEAEFAAKYSELHPGVTPPRWKDLGIQGDEVKLICEEATKEQMTNASLLVKALYFPDGEWDIVKDASKSGTNNWQYSGLLKEETAYGPFFKAIERNVKTAHLNMQEMVGHGAPPLLKSENANSTEELNPAFQAAMSGILLTASKQGVTTFVEGGATPDMITSYKSLVANQQAFTRIRAVYNWAAMPQNENVDYKISFDDASFNGMLSAEGIKLWADGSTQGCSANLSQPYDEDGLCQSFGDGHTNYDDKQIIENLTPFAQKGWYFNIHANGDKGISDAINALSFMQEKVAGMPMDNPQKECLDETNKGKYQCLPYTIIHSTVNNPGNKATGETAEILELYEQERAKLPYLSPSHLVGHIAYWGRSMENELGEFRGGTIDPMGSEVTAGIPFSMHSDLSISALFPLWFIEQGVTRDTWFYPHLKDSQRSALYEEERIAISDAIRAVTIVPAQQHGIDQQLGSIERGKLADLIVVDKNPLTYAGNEANIHAINVECAFINGKQVDWSHSPEGKTSSGTEYQSQCQLD